MAKLVQLPISCAGQICDFAGEALLTPAKQFGKFNFFHNNDVEIFKPALDLMSNSKDGVSITTDASNGEKICDTISSKRSSIFNALVKSAFGETEAEIEKSNRDTARLNRKTEQVKAEAERSATAPAAPTTNPAEAAKAAAEAAKEAIEKLKAELKKALTTTATTPPPPAPTLGGRGRSYS